MTLITLGVDNLADARAFYARLGWKEHPASQPAVAFFQMHSTVSDLFGRIVRDQRHHFDAEFRHRIRG